MRIASGGEFIMDFMPGEDDGYTPVTPIPAIPVQDNGASRLNDLLAVASLIAFIWRLFDDRK